jgi:hypothetical protein
MLLITLPRWNDPDAYYSQENNVVETILAKVKADRKLETCGPTSAVMLLDAIGHNIKTLTPGGWQPQPEDILAAWFNDPRNYPAMRKVRDIDPASIMGNEVPQWYEAAVPAVFGVPAKFYHGVTFEAIEYAIKQIRGVMLTLNSPGHYIAVVGVDTEAKEVIYHDPWPNNPWPVNLKGTPGRARRVLWSVLANNLKPYRVEIG